MAGREQYEVRRSPTKLPSGRVESVWVDRLWRLRGAPVPHRVVELTTASNAAAVQVREASDAAQRAAGAAQGAAAVDPLRPGGVQELPPATEAPAAALRVTTAEAILAAAETEKVALDIQAVLMAVPAVGTRLPERCKPYEGGWIDRS